MLAGPEGAVVHDLKSHSEPFFHVWDGRKPYELRRNDRGFEVGHYLRLREWDPATEKYSGRQMLLRIEYMTPGGAFELPKHLCILGLSKVLAKEP